MAKKVLIDNLSEPLNGARTAKVDIHVGDGNLTIDGLSGSEQVLASGTLEYLENQSVPQRTAHESNGQATLTLRGGAAGQPWFRFPWSACNGATLWQIHLNPAVQYDVTARSSGGNVKLDLGRIPVTGVSADTGGGNMEVVLPDQSANYTVVAQSGAGNVLVKLPTGVAVRVRATTGLGKVFVDPQFSQTEKNTYQSADWEFAANRIDITAKSGAGNVSVSIK
jgi:hypothetical protein